jgi:ribonucleotide monophosphatase NagD (HAD superfamily)
MSIVFLDMDGTLIPGNAPDVPCSKHDPFGASRYSRAEFQNSVAAVISAAKRVGETHTVSAADTEWMNFIQGCYAPMYRPVSARDVHGTKSSDPKLWKVRAFTDLMRGRRGGRVVVVGDRADSEIAAGRTVAAQHGAEYISLHVREPTTLDAAMQTHREIISFLERL